ncbi:MAG: hypothetical protein ACWGOX_09670 [Desulforhopalus sp.]
MAQNSDETPEITLTAENEPLGDLLDTISQNTGYRFNLDKAWADYPVSTSIVKLPLERGLKRLLRNLNYTIIWEADKVISISILGKVDPKVNRPDTSPVMPIPAYTAEPEPASEPGILTADQHEGNDQGVEENQENVDGEMAADSGNGSEELTSPDSAQEEPAENSPVETETPSEYNDSGGS